MNWLKAMLLMVVLGAILYGVNVVLNKSAPVDSPANNGAWSAEGATNPPIITPGATGMSAPAGNPASSFGQQPIQQPGKPWDNGSQNPSATNPPTGYAANGGNSTIAPPADPSPYGTGASQTIIGASPPSAVPADPTPPVANSEPARPGIPATPVGLVTGSQYTASQPDAAVNPGGGTAFASAMDIAVAALRDGRLAEGLQRLTLWYDDPRLNLDETKQLNDLLGRLAGTVVYSRQHLLLRPYEVKPGDRLETIANDYRIPARLLAKINGIGDPDHLTPGDKLKVIHGPFMAFVNLNKREVELVVQQCYAGRFKLTSVGKDASAQGVFKVATKSFDAPNYPLIHNWVGFTNGCWFGGASDSNPGDDPHGLLLNSGDAEELFDILTVGSSVVVR